MWTKYICIYIFENKTQVGHGTWPRPWHVRETSLRVSQLPCFNSKFTSLRKHNIYNAFPCMMVRIELELKRIFNIINLKISCLV